MLRKSFTKRVEWFQVRTIPCPCGEAFAYLAHGEVYGAAGGAKFVSLLQSGLEEAATRKAQAKLDSIQRGGLVGRAPLQPLSELDARAEPGAPAARRRGVHWLHWRRRGLRRPPGRTRGEDQRRGRRGDRLRSRSAVRTARRRARGVAPGPRGAARPRCHDLRRARRLPPREPGTRARVGAAGEPAGRAPGAHVRGDQRRQSEGHGGGDPPAQDPPPTTNTGAPPRSLAPAFLRRPSPPRRGSRRGRLSAGGGPRRRAGRTWWRYSG